MNAIEVLAIALIATGVTVLIYGMVAVPQGPHHATVGSMELSVMGPKSVNFPLWAGLAAILGGGLLLFVPGRVRIRD